MRIIAVHREGVKRPPAYNPTGMRNVRLTIAYVGTRYAGWQVQPGRPTIQGVLEDRLTRMLQEKVSLAGAGRTDSGVHAQAQVANFATARDLSLDGLRRGLNAILPEDIRVMEARDVDGSFHARSDARSKSYRYRLSRAEVVSPFVAPFVHPVRGRLDVGAMQEAAARFVGRHDFTSFSPASCELEDRVRHLMQARLEEPGEEIVFHVRGRGFLRHMIRTMVGTLLVVGKGRLAPDGIDAILQARDRRAAGPVAAARGLTLMRVFYAEDEA